MTDEELAGLLFGLLGGGENIESVTSCMTRLRVTVRDVALVDCAGIRATEGVLGLVEAQTMHIVLGPGRVGRARVEFEELLASGGVGVAVVSEDEATPAAKAGSIRIARSDGLSAKEGETTRASDIECASPAALGATSAAETPVISEVQDAASANKSARKSKYAKWPVQTLLKRCANVFAALLPGIIAAGLISGVCNVINVSTDGSLASVWWFQTIRSIGWALFAYLPILVGYNSAREFGGSPVLGGVAGMMCIANSSMPLLATSSDEAASAILLPFTNQQYNPAAGGMLAALFAGIFFALLERAVRKLMPDLVDTFATPLVVLLVGVFALVLVIQPLSSSLTTAIFAGIQLARSQASAVAGYAISAGFLPLVSVGLHQALVPIHTMLNDPNGPTHGINYLYPVLMMAGGGQVGAGLALFAKSENAKLRKFVAQSVPVGVLGVAEPLMYAVTLPLVRPFVTACLGAGFGGALAAVLDLGTVSHGVSGLFGLLIVVPGQQLQYLLCIAVSCVAGFILTWLFGVDKGRIDAVFGD